MGPWGYPARSHARQADDPARSDFLDRFRNDRSNTGALDDCVRLETDIQYAPGVIRSSESTHEVRLQTGLDTIEDMDLESSQTHYGGRQEANRTRAGHQHGLGFPECSLGPQPAPVPTLL